MANLAELPPANQLPMSYQPDVRNAVSSRAACLPRLELQAIFLRLLLETGEDFRVNFGRRYRDHRNVWPVRLGACLPARFDPNARATRAFDPLAGAVGQFPARGFSEVFSRN